MLHAYERNKATPLWGVGFGLGSSAVCGTRPLQHHYPENLTYRHAQQHQNRVTHNCQCKAKKERMI